eukprot:m.125612 g.125612  ORF g.125612 m.125612 type:complete len:830 (-) comp17333_c0_seq1:1275-3764(-)
MTTKYKQEFADAQQTSIDEQSKLFLLAFAVEFSGKSEEVLGVVEDFKTYLKFSTDVALNQTDAHRLLERKGRAHTAMELRTVLREIDQDNDNHVSALEWLLFEYKKTIDQMFDAFSTVPAHLRKAMEEAIAEYRRVQAEREALANKRKELEALVAKGGVKGMRAQNELHQIRSRGGSMYLNMADVRSKFMKRKTQKLVDAAKGTGDDAALQEAAKQEELRREKAKEEKAAEHARRRSVSRRTLMARAAAFGGDTAFLKTHDPETKKFATLKKGSRLEGITETDSTTDITNTSTVSSAATSTSEKLSFTSSGGGAPAASTAKDGGESDEHDDDDDEAEVDAEVSEAVLCEKIKRAIDRYDDSEPESSERNELLGDITKHVHATQLSTLPIDGLRCPLAYAVQHQKAGAVVMLLYSGARACDAPVGDLGESLLHRAITHVDANTDIVSALINSGVSVDIEDNDGRTPLHYACQGGDARVVQFLIDNGADVTKLDKAGQNALDFAEQFSDVVAALEAAGATNGAGTTAEVDDQLRSIFDFYAKGADTIAIESVVALARLTSYPPWGNGADGQASESAFREQLHQLVEDNGWQADGGSLTFDQFKEMYASDQEVFADFDKLDAAKDFMPQVYDTSAKFKGFVVCLILQVGKVMFDWQTGEEDVSDAAAHAPLGGVLPVLVHNGMHLSHFGAVSRYAARLGGLVGSEDGAEDAVIAKSDMLLEESRAILDICEACNNSKSGGATKWEDLLTSVLTPKLKRLDVMVGVAATPTVTGAQRLLAGDVAVFATMEILKDVLPTITDAFKNLAQFCSTVAQQPEIKIFLQEARQPLLRK